MAPGEVIYKITQEMVSRGLVDVESTEDVWFYIQMAYAAGLDSKQPEPGIPIVQLDVAGNIINYFPSIVAASRVLKIGCKVIRKSIENGKTYKGRYFRKATGKEIIRESQSRWGVVFKDAV